MTTRESDREIAERVYREQRDWIIDRASVELGVAAGREAKRREIVECLEQRAVELREAERAVDTRQGGKQGDGYVCGMVADELDGIAARLKETR